MKIEIDIRVLVSLNYLFSLQNEYFRNKHLLSQRTRTVSSTCLIRLRFQGNRCKSGISIYAWRFSWNYAYSPFKQFFWFLRSAPQTKQNKNCINLKNCCNHFLIIEASENFFFIVFCLFSDNIIRLNIFSGERVETNSNGF